MAVNAAALLRRGFKLISESKASDKEKLNEIYADEV